MTELPDGEYEWVHPSFQHIEHPNACGAAADLLTLALKEERRLRGRLCGLIGRHPDTSDLLQDVYLDILLAAQNPTLKLTSVKAYAVTAAKNKAIDWLKHHRIVDEFISDIAVDADSEHPGGEEPEVLASMTQELEFLVKTVNQLPNRTRQIFVLLRIEGLSHKQVARALNVSVNTVEQLSARGSQRVVEHIRRQGDAYPLLQILARRFTRSARTDVQAQNHTSSGAQVADKSLQPLQRAGEVSNSVSSHSVSPT